MNQEEPFIRYISAKQLMERWDINHVALSQMPIPARILTGPIDPFQCISKSFNNIRRFLPYSKEDFEKAVYDIYDVEQYEYNHPEVVPSVADDEKEPDLDFTGKQRQEYGRLRAEKINMDASIRASIEVGKFVQQKLDSGEKIKKADVVDLINSVEREIPSTRIDQIWKEIPDMVKHGPGRPKNGKT
jgi:hypothetical protein